MKITRYEFEDGTDVEFVPSRTGHEVWVCGILVDLVARGERPSELRAHYYHEIHARRLPEVLGVASSVASAHP